MYKKKPSTKITILLFNLMFSYTFIKIFLKRLYNYISYFTHLFASIQTEHATKTTHTKLFLFPFSKMSLARTHFKRVRLRCDECVWWRLRAYFGVGVSFYTFYVCVTLLRQPHQHPFFILIYSAKPSSDQTNTQTLVVVFWSQNANKFTHFNH